MASLNPSQRYAMSMAGVSEPLTYGTVPVPKRTGGTLIPSAPVFETYSNPYVEEFQTNQQYYPTPKQSVTTENEIPTWAWVSIAAVGGLVLLYMIK